MGVLWTCSEDSRGEGGGGRSRAAAESGEVRSARIPFSEQSGCGWWRPQSSVLAWGVVGAMRPELQKALEADNLEARAEERVGVGASLHTFTQHRPLELRGWWRQRRNVFVVTGGNLSASLMRGRCVKNVRNLRNLKITFQFA